jgi:hypothetical protein
VDYHGREKATATLPQFAGKEAEHDGGRGDDATTPQVNDAE